MKRIKVLPVLYPFLHLTYLYHFLLSCGAQTTSLRVGRALIMRL